MFDKIPSQINFPEQEQEILEFWEENRVFRKSLDQRKGNQEYVFYDGPPFATGLPHYGHLLAGTIKDVVPRYQTMLGKYVDRVFGWDCHGLPVENEMEQELKIKSKSEIEKYGVHNFNEDCRNIVLRYTGEWEQVVKRIGRWVDFENGYRTMDKNYMESIWWVFKELWTKGLIYEGHKILPYCPRCATPLSNFEANQGYNDVDDPSITIKFKVTGEPSTYVLAWTTTPWTLPSNLALAVGEKIEYSKILDGENIYILASDRLSTYYKDNAHYKVIERVQGKDLVGINYEPLLPYFISLSAENAFRIVDAEFVSTSDGTGIVHIAPGFGEDDATIGKINKLPTVCPIDAECQFTQEIVDYRGRFVKDCDREIIARLKKEKKLIHQSTIRHSYPHCWRCESPLIYRAISTWFVKVEAIKEQLLEANDHIQWVPGHLKRGRFGKWLENAHDWAISRNRYWGCPLPIWRNEDGTEMICFGSIFELEEHSGESIEDIHKHFVDKITIISNTTGKKLTRIPEVLDCWFESGSMPYAQKHYPFEKKEWLENHFPADFIAEGLDQTRGWFYTLVVLGAALFDKPAFKNVVVNGFVLAEDGRKMSKRLKNYPAPESIMAKYGADALRLCLLSSPVMRGEDLRFSENTVKETIRSVMLPFWNSYSFLITYARIDGWKPTFSMNELHHHLTNPLDRWIFSRLMELVGQVMTNMDRYDIQAAVINFDSFVDNLTNWYIRRSRRRFWKSQNDADKNEAYHTLYYVLLTLCKTSAPFIPFITETIYLNLKSNEMPESVHLCDFPSLSEEYNDPDLNTKMKRTIKTVSLGRYLRSQANIRTRQPLQSAILVSMNAKVRNDLEAMKEIIMEELNVKNVIIEDGEEKLVTLTAKANYRSLGPKLGKNMKEVAAKIAKFCGREINDLRKGNVLPIHFCETGKIDIGIDDIEIRRQEKPGIAAANEGEITVALDLNLDESLKLEGLAREVVNRIQNLRKEAGFDVSDRIKIFFDVPHFVNKAIGKHEKYISKETLATELISSASLDGDTSLMILEHECKFKLEQHNSIG